MCVSSQYWTSQNNHVTMFSGLVKHTRFLPKQGCYNRKYWNLVNMLKHRVAGMITSWVNWNTHWYNGCSRSGTLYRIDISVKSDAIKEILVRFQFHFVILFILRPSGGHLQAFNIDHNWIYLVSILRCGANITAANWVEILFKLW